MRFLLAACLFTLTLTGCGNDPGKAWKPEPPGIPTAQQNSRGIGGARTLDPALARQ